MIKNSQNWICSTHPSIGKCNCHYSSSLHNPRQRIPHKPQELQELALLKNTQKDNSPQNSNFLSGAHSTSDKEKFHGQKKKKREKNKVKLWTFFSSSLLWPKMTSLSSAASLLRPSLLHLRFSKTSSMGMFSCIKKKKKPSMKPKKAQQGRGL